MGEEVWGMTADGSEALFGTSHRALLDGLGDAVVVAGLDNRIVYLNPAAEKLFGRLAADSHGLALTSLMPERLRDAHLSGFARYQRSRESRILGVPVRVPALRADGDEVPVELTISEYGHDGQRLFMAVVRDLTEHVKLERQAALAGPLRAVSETAAALGNPRATTVEDVARPLLEALTDSLGWSAAALWLVEVGAEAPGSDGAAGGGTGGDGSGSQRLVCADVWDDAQSDPEWARESRRHAFAMGEGLPGRVWASGEAVWIDDVAEDPNYPRAPAAERRGLHGALAFPVVAGERTVGVIEVYSSQVQEPDPDVLGAVSAVGQHLGLFLERSLVLRDLRAQMAVTEAGQQAAAELARTLEASLLPPLLPSIPHLELAARYRSGAKGMVVSGDFYDLFALADQGWGVVIGDVQGKGAQAAVATGLARYTIRSVTAHRHEPADALRELNRALHRHAEESAALHPWEGVGCTACYLRVRTAPALTRIEVACGGHPPPVLLRADGTVEAVPCAGTVLGLLGDDELSVAVVDVELAAGDAMILYTDGLVEARQEGDLFGQGRLGDVLAELAGMTADGIAQGIVDAVLEFTDGQLRDDLAIVVMRVPAA